jgi:hypothetical protein
MLHTPTSVQKTKVERCTPIFYLTKGTENILKLGREANSIQIDQKKRSSYLNYFSYTLEQLLPFN